MEELTMSSHSAPKELFYTVKDKLIDQNVN
jgi:hypothetical protein